MVSLGGLVAGGTTISIVIRGVDKFSAVFKRANSGINLLKKGLMAGAVAVGVFAVAMGAVGIASIKAAADFEQTQIAFTTMLGSAEEATAFLKELADFAKKTPFTIQGVEKSARQLMAVGFEAKDVLPVLKDVGDIAAGLGLGEEGLQRIILNLGQVQAQGKLTGRELRDFAVAGIPLLSELGKQLNVSTKEVQAMVSAGEISTDIVLQAFKNMTSEGGRFADLMSKQALTVQGKFSNLKDSISLMARELGAVLLPIVAELADTFLNDVLPAIEPLIPIIGDLLKQALEAIIPFLPSLIDLLTRLVTTFSGLLTIILPLMEPLTELAMVLFIAIFDAIDALLPTLEELVPVLVELLVAVTPLIPSLGQILVLAIQLAVAGIKPLIPIIKAVIPIFEWWINILNKIIGVIKTVVGWIKQLVSWMAKISMGAISAISSAFSSRNKSNPRNVDDAIIRPNGEIIRTHPKDTIIATKNPEGLGGSGIIINIENVYGVDANDVADALQDKLNAMIST